MFWSRPLRALIGTYRRVLTASPITVQAEPRIVSNFYKGGGFVPVLPRAFLRSATRVFLYQSVREAMVVNGVGVYGPVIRDNVHGLGGIARRVCATRVVPWSRESSQR